MEHQSAKIIAPFTFSAFRLSIRATEPLYLPAYKGSALRGSFGHALRKVACVVMDKECKNCLLAPRCVYAFVFEPRPDEDDPFLRNKDRVANPYIIRPPLEKREEYKPGEKLSFELILVGKISEYLPYFVYAFMQMGQRGLGRGRFMLERIDNLKADGSLMPVYLSDDQILRNESEPITCRDLLEIFPPREQCRFRFLTRLELKEKRKYPEVRFGVLFRSLLRRITTLAHLHCGISCTDIDFKILSHAADDVRTLSSDLRWEHAVRYSNRQKRCMPFGGLVGNVTFEGDLTLFWPFILLGEWMHMGKKTSFGLGRYLIEN
ncbi:CRISPR system precrRNA processing endoribonuclease RAMP protein Cas6 [Desulfonema magnum]|uniref:CRISPR-associated endoribonuclease domain-containing protein n=1 Tax=Desulfonema magnum TaxID=45655 RepID=A0A975BUP4_9BACT|nr:CRISPR system precrRNA processing endoribonuclease RAMP protein Cas6 [Desulfonema magnum]QTA92086.1 CRISPR-associated endoribonuclease domain-containing protein [Desulfonema magnum]